MSLISIIFLSLALAVDTFVVSAARGSAIYRPSLRHAVLVAGVFAAAHMLMPLAGWRVGLGYRPLEHFPITRSRILRRRSSSDIPAA